MRARSKIASLHPMPATEQSDHAPFASDGTPAGGPESVSEARPPAPPVSGPAKWVALGIVAGGSLVGIVWSLQSSSKPAPPVERAMSLNTIAAPQSVDEQRRSEAESARTIATSASRLVNLNTATEAELDMLPGVGKVTARAILDYRARHGAFRVLSELDKIKGIGPATIEKLRPLVTLEDTAPTGPM